MKVRFTRFSLLLLLLCGATTASAAALTALNESCHKALKNLKAPQTLHICTQAATQGWQEKGQHPKPAAQAQDNLGDYYLATRKIQKAEEFYRRAYAIRRNAYGAESAELAQSLTKIASSLTHSGRHPDAETLMLRALYLKEIHFGKNSTEVANSLHLFGTIKLVANKPEEAVPLFRRALEIRKKHLGTKSATVANTQQALAISVQRAKATRKPSPFSGKHTTPSLPQPEKTAFYC